MQKGMLSNNKAFLKRLMDYLLDEFLSSQRFTPFLTEELLNNQNTDRIIILNKMKLQNCDYGIYYQYLKSKAEIIIINSKQEVLKKIDINLLCMYLTLCVLSCHDIATTSRKNLL